MAKTSIAWPSALEMLCYQAMYGDTAATRTKAKARIRQWPRHNPQDRQTIEDFDLKKFGKRSAWKPRGLTKKGEFTRLAVDDCYRLMALGCPAKTAATTVFENLRKGGFTGPESFQDILHRHLRNGRYRYGAFKQSRSARPQ